MNFLKNLFLLIFSRKQKTKVRDATCLMMESGGKEHCVICFREMNILKSTPIDLRPYYIEGIGQLCEECWNQK